MACMHRLLFLLAFFVGFCHPVVFFFMGLKARSVPACIVLVALFFYNNFTIDVRQSCRLKAKSLAR